MLSVDYKGEGHIWPI